MKSRKDPEQKISAWEAQYDEKPHADLILGPFGCLAHLVLQKEHRLARLDPKDDTDEGIGFGVRSIVGVFLGVHVDPVTMFYTNLITDGKNVYTSKKEYLYDRRHLLLQHHGTTGYRDCAESTPRRGGRAELGNVCCVTLARQT